MSVDKVRIEEIPAVVIEWLSQLPAGTIIKVSEDRIDIMNPLKCENVEVNIQ